MITLEEIDELKCLEEGCCIMAFDREVPVDDIQFLVLRGNPDVYCLQVFIQVTAGAFEELIVATISVFIYGEKFISQVDACVILFIRDVCSAGRHSRQYQ